MASINSQPRAPATIGAIADAMNIVNTIYGIKTNNQKLAQMEAEAKKQAEQQAKMQDPNSQQSMLLRDVMNKQGIQAPDTASAADLSPLMSFAEQAQKGKMQSDLEKQKLAAMMGMAQMKAENAPEKAIKPTQYVAGGFANRIAQSEDTFQKLLDKGYDPTTATAAVQRSGLFPEIMKSEDAKKQSQAERNFVNAVLRRESGAAISPSEFASAETQYFPRVGDTQELLKQKAENRRGVLAALKTEAGPAVEQIQATMQGIPQANIPSSIGGKGTKAQLMPTAQAGASAITPDDLDALKFIQANPKDPNAAKISGILKAKGLLK